MTSSFMQDFLERVKGTRLEQLGISSPFTIPSGIVTTVPSVIARIAREVPEIGFITTKTLSIHPREGYREPILHEYFPGCFVNAVGIPGPGAQAFRAAMEPLLPLHGGKPLLVSIMGNSPEEFLACAQELAPIADGFELNLSCPHVKGAGQCVGSDPDAVHNIIAALRAEFEKPIIPKLSPNLGNIPEVAVLCRDAGADGLALINTVGPGIACDEDGQPILSNVAGGVSGAAVLPIGVKAVAEAAAVVNLPIIAMGGISSAVDVTAYARAGAALFGIGSALAGMTTAEIASFFRSLTCEQPPKRQMWNRTATLTEYLKTTVKANIPVAENMFKLVLERGPRSAPGRFFFLRLPGAGEKPFSPASDEQPEYLVRTVGPFTASLELLKPGDSIFMRGPYGRGFPPPPAGARLILVGGGTGVAPLIMAARDWSEAVAKSFFGFSRPVSTEFRAEIAAAVPHLEIVIDPEDRPGEVVRRLGEDVAKDPQLYGDSTVFLCGPAAMMRTAIEVLSAAVPTSRMFVAREDLMRCGIGVCGSCGTPSGLRSCVDGPVLPPEW
ncbi:MAG: tRNA-dihydrouridine synthase [Desulfomonile sp.]|nr:tRNA-dihydrouridine synthase [Desulfomonile sp.]